MQTPRLNEQEPIFSGLCNEPGRQMIRSVYPMALSPENIKKFWSFASNFKVLFGDEINGDEKKFYEVLMSRAGDNLLSNGLFWRVDDFVGIYYMTAIQSHDALIHYSFFDRRHKGRVELTRMMIKHVFEKYGFNTPVTDSITITEHTSIPKLMEELYGSRIQGTQGHNHSGGD